MATLTETELKSIETALQSLLKAYNDLMPGVRFLALQDYTILNTAPIQGEEALQLVQRLLK